MGNPYHLLEQHFSNVNVDPETDIVVEIGSGVGEGSTQWLYNWASQRQLPFYSIDVTNDTKNQLGHLNINFVIESGHVWCRDVLPTLKKKIKVLYLDNFDYIWEPTPNNLEAWGDQKEAMLDMFNRQIKSYAERGVILNNKNSMEEHRLQTLYCLPFMSQESSIIMDDTYEDEQGIYGKCATAIPLMLNAGYELISKYNLAYRKHQ